MFTTIFIVALRSLFGSPQCGLVQGFLCGSMAKEANKRANNVLKYRRWRNTGAAGNSPTSYRGDVFDTAFGAEI